MRPPKYTNFVESEGAGGSSSPPPPDLAPHLLLTSVLSPPPPPPPLPLASSHARCSAGRDGSQTASARNTNAVAASATAAKAAAAAARAAAAAARRVATSQSHVCDRSIAPGNEIADWLADCGAKGGKRATGDTRSSISLQRAERWIESWLQQRQKRPGGATTPTRGQIEDREHRTRTCNPHRG